MTCEWKKGKVVLTFEDGDEKIQVRMTPGMAEQLLKRLGELNRNKEGEKRDGVPVQKMP